MELFTLAYPGLEEVARQEIEELAAAKVKAGEQLLNFSVNNNEQLFTLIHRSQSLRKVAAFITKFIEVDKIEFSKLNFTWNDYLPKEFSLKVTVENVKGNDNRIELSRKFLGKLFPFLEKELKLVPRIDLKHPDIEIIICRSGKEYFVGIDLCGKELNTRQYRIFVNHAAFKGDFGYYLVRKCGFKSGEKMLVGFAKDGTAAIEAALFANKMIVTPLSLELAYKKIPLFKEIGVKKIFDAQKFSTPTLISGFDESNQNMIAARKNSALAKTKELINFTRCALDDLEMRFSGEQFDRIILQITTKDEANLNEIYLQMGALVKPKGTLLILARGGFELPIPGNFKALLEEEFQRGDSKYKIWVLERK